MEQLEIAEKIHFNCFTVMGGKVNIGFEQFDEFD